MLVDAAGAAQLHWRIEQQQNWRQAQSVVDGRQPAMDPDSSDLISFGDGVRVYSERHTSDGRLHLCKRLVDGVWEHGTVNSDECVALTQSHQVPGPVGGWHHVAHVA
jgi:hypothetical protein